MIRKSLHMAINLRIGQLLGSPTGTIHAEVDGSSHTARIEILKMIASGDASWRITEQLFVTPATVKTHINNPFRKLDVISRAQAVAHGRDIGLVNQ